MYGGGGAYETCVCGCVCGGGGAYETCVCGDVGVGVRMKRVCGCVCGGGGGGTCATVLMHVCVCWGPGVG